MPRLRGARSTTTTRTPRTCRGGTHVDADDGRRALPFVAQRIANGDVVGCPGTHGARPRALGQRSIVTDRAATTMKDILNARSSTATVPPFARRCSAARGEWISRTTRRRSWCSSTDRDRRAEAVPAMNHVDDTAGSVRRGGVLPRYHRLISEFEKLTGCLSCSTLLQQNEPIVMTPRIAIEPSEDKDGCSCSGTTSSVALPACDAAVRHPSYVHPTVRAAGRRRASLSDHRLRTRAVRAARLLSLRTGPSCSRTPAHRSRGASPASRHIGQYVCRTPGRFSDRSRASEHSPTQRRAPGAVTSRRSSERLPARVGAMIARRRDRRWHCIALRRTRVRPGRLLCAQHRRRETRSTRTSLVLESTTVNPNPVDWADSAPMPATAKERLGSTRAPGRLVLRIFSTRRRDTEFPPGGRPRRTSGIDATYLVVGGRWRTPRTSRRHGRILERLGSDGLRDGRTQPREPPPAGGQRPIHPSRPTLRACTRRATWSSRLRRARARSTDP